MKVILPYLLAVASLLSACAFHNGKFPSKSVRISYYDRDKDGKVDLEVHQNLRASDADWELRDEDYDGRYDKKRSFGVGVFDTVVDVPVPVGVKIGG